jgi:hypothetical protein
MKKIFIFIIGIFLLTCCEKTHTEKMYEKSVRRSTICWSNNTDEWLSFKIEGIGSCFDLYPQCQDFCIPAVSFNNELLVGRRWTAYKMRHEPYVVWDDSIVATGIIKAFIPITVP